LTAVVWTVLAAAGTPSDRATSSEAALGFPITPARSSSRPTTPVVHSATTSSAQPPRSTISSPATRTALKEKANLVFQDLPTHMFEIGKFNDDTMASPPGFENWHIGAVDRITETQETGA
jgi:hypothetical protein